MTGAATPRIKLTAPQADHELRCAGYDTFWNEDGEVDYR